MSKWDEYQDFSTNAKPHGGANAYLDFLENNAREEGREEGVIEGVIKTLVVLAIPAALAGGKWVYDKVSNRLKKRKQEKQLASIVRQEFLDNVEQYEAQENNELPEN